MSSSRRSSRGGTERLPAAAPWRCLLWLPLLLLAASGNAGAEVFEAIPGRGGAGLFGGLRAELELGARRVASWNGVRVERQQGRTRRRPAELFDRVERRASPAGAEAGASGDESDFAARLRRRIERGHRRDGTGWSVLVRLPDRARDVRQS